MRKINWKRFQPTSIRAALEGCKDYARERHNLSVERIAERMGLADHWTLYKWIESGRMPAVAIPSYESACGINLITRWLACRDGKLLIEVPAGRTPEAKDFSQLQSTFHSAVGLLIRFYEDGSNLEETLQELSSTLESIAWHRNNVSQHSQPQLEFGGSND